MGDQLGAGEEPTLFLMSTLSLVLFTASAVIWSSRTQPRKWPLMHVVATILFVQVAWGVAWLLYGLDFWNGFIAPAFMVLKTSVRLLPFLLKAL